ncbi:hypothetical protein Taro_005367 [Colocasia esculenta]|uniref:Uncharacterized protein n=1 Tax=Colocasia esculenta TaxID=4460 RepID=A0A843TSU4_COLES|nr:hypothetical protein [Colocasia esculenta]
MSASHVGAPPAMVGTPAPAVNQTDNVPPVTPVAAVGNVAKADLADRFTAESAPISRSESPFDPRWKDDLREMNRKIEALQLGTRAPSVATLLTSSPFTEEITSAPVGFSSPTTARRGQSLGAHPARLRPTILADFFQQHLQ